MQEIHRSEYIHNKRPVTEKWNWVIAFLSAVLAISLFISVKNGLKEDQPPRWERQASYMDTYFSLIVYGDSSVANRAMDSAFAIIERIERIASIFDSTTEAFRLNRDGRIANPSPDLVEILQLSKSYYDRTEGAFDITVEPVLRLWKEGLWKNTPEEQFRRISEIKHLIGSDKLCVSEDSIVFLQKGMLITLGAIAKGFAVDKAMQAIEQAGVTIALVNGGGNVVTRGVKPGNEPWRLDLVDPDDKNRSVASFQITDRAVATSGNYERYYDAEIKVHHIIDPRTGFPASDCISVTILTDKGVDADALSTSVFVLGSVEGLKLVESMKGVEAFIINNKRNIYKSPNLEVYESTGSNR